MKTKYEQPIERLKQTVGQIEEGSKVVRYGGGWRSQ